MESASFQTGYALINGLNMYYEIHGTGEPLVLLHGGLGMGGMFAEILPSLTATRQVILPDLQAHGRTTDIDRPIRLEQMGDDIAALISHLGFDKVDLIGYSMGGGTALRTALQHPELIRRLVLVSVPFKREGWYPEILSSMGQMSAAAAEYMKETPMYQAYTAIAPDPEQFPRLLDKVGDMVRLPYDWSGEIAALKKPVLLIYGDADSIPPSHAVQFFELLGGGMCDGSWDGSGISQARLAILPGTTHYTIFNSPALVSVVKPFLEEPVQ